MRDVGGQALEATKIVWTRSWRIWLPLAGSLGVRRVGFRWLVWGYRGT